MGNHPTSLLFSKLYPSYSGILVLLADASMLDERAPPMQGILISWMLRLSMHLGTGNLTLAEKTPTPLTDAHMIEVERGLCISKGIHRAGGWDVVPEHLAKLLRHHRLR